jgi:diadenosine tetraphosphatase ApaH/serine/threonine PP2A family protein phosphatase
VRYLVLTDQHANLHALDAVLADAKTVGYDQVLVLGDLVGYGADPAGVIERTIALAPVAIVRGNHDKVCAGLEPAALFNDVARQSIEWTASVLSPAELKYLADLPQGPRQLGNGVEICHGTPFDEDHYVFDTSDAARAIAAAKAPKCLFGHTHVPVIFASGSRPNPGRDDLREDEIELPEEGCVLINVGSVGQPRDGDPRAAYGVLDLERRSILMRRVAYDIAGAQARILAAKLPHWLAARLERGQ